MGQAEADAALANHVKESREELLAKFSAEVMQAYDEVCQGAVETHNEAVRYHFKDVPAKLHVQLALTHLLLASEKTTDPGLQGDLERARAKLQRRIDLTQGL